MTPSAVVSNTTPSGPLVDKDGRALYPFIKWMQSIGTLVNQGFDPDGKFQGAIGTRATIDGRATLASIVQYISTGGVVQAQGIDFALAYLNKDTDHIADGLGSPLAGGKAAYTALLQSPPTVTPHQWVRGLTGGVFTQSQPAFADISGTIATAQLPTTGVTPGSYTNTNLTVDAQGRITAAADGSGSGGSYGDSETPSGAVDGANVTFTLANAPSPALSLQLFVNGMLQRQGGGDDYTLAASTITFNAAPTIGAVLLGWYRF